MFHFEVRYVNYFQDVNKLMQYKTCKNRGRNEENTLCCVQTQHNVCIFSIIHMRFS